MARPVPVMRDQRPDLVRSASNHVMFPADDVPFEAEAWDGWPVNWDVPNWNRLGFGFGASDPDGYLNRVSTVMTAVDLNARSLATFPIYGVADLGESGQRFDLPDWATNPEPNRYSSWAEFMRVALNTYQLHGEAILWATARDSAGWPARFVALAPDAVEVGHTMGAYTYKVGEQHLDPADVCHIRYTNLPESARGLSPLCWSAQNIVSAAALEKYGAHIAAYGVTAVLTHPGNLNRQQADDLKASWLGARAANPGSPAVLSGGVGYDVLSLSPTDMALLDLRIFDEQRIAAALGVPPFLIGLPNPGGMTYSTTNSLFTFHWKGTLRPMAEAFSQAMSQWLLPGPMRMEFNRDEYVRPDLLERAQAYSVMAAIQQDGVPALRVSEIRHAERLAPNNTPVATTVAAPPDLTPGTEMTP